MCFHAALFLFAAHENGVAYRFVARGGKWHVNRRRQNLRGGKTGGKINILNNKLFMCSKKCNVLQSNDSSYS
jgi:hypothetical protein